MTSLTLSEQLKNYRRRIGEAKDIALFMIFNNKSLNDLVLKQPQTKEELAQVNGFAAKKIETYGAEILEIIKTYRQNFPELAASESAEIAARLQTETEEKELADGSNLYNIFCGALFSFNSFSKDDGALALCYDTPKEYEDINALYRLNDIVISGTTYTKCLSLMNYQTAHMLHNGNYDNHIRTGLLDLLEYAWDAERKESLNCLCLAHILRSFMLSQNIKARVVYMFPFSPYDKDNHVVTEAWLEEQQKWVMFDPTYNTCVSDQNGVLLSVAELRDALSHHEKIFFADQTAYCQKPLTGKELDELAAYYAKDCFFFKINENQTRNGAAAGKTAVIIPDGFDYEKFMLLKNRPRRREIFKPISFLLER